MHSKPNDMHLLLRKALTGHNLLLAGGSLLSFLLLAYRITVTGDGTFLFLVWNWFLALIPYLLSSALIISKRLQRWHLIVPLLITWFLFLPNAPYILTDLFHLKQRSMPLWFDLVMILSFAWSGLLFGLLSLQQIQRYITQRSHRFWGICFSCLALFASAFGIYLGRYLRWNSWDVLRSPSAIIADSIELLLDPAHNSSGVGMTLAYGSFFIFIYFSLQMMAQPTTEASR